MNWESLKEYLFRERQPPSAEEIERMFANSETRLTCQAIHANCCPVYQLRAMMRTFKGCWKIYLIVHLVGVAFKKKNPNASKKQFKDHLYSIFKFSKKLVRSYLFVIFIVNLPRI